MNKELPFLVVVNWKSSVAIIVRLMIIRSNSLRIQTIVWHTVSVTVSLELLITEMYFVTGHARFESRGRRIDFERLCGRLSSLIPVSMESKMTVYSYWDSFFSNNLQCRVAPRFTFKIAHLTFEAHFRTLVTHHRWFLIYPLTTSNQLSIFQFPRFWIYSFS